MDRMDQKREAFRRSFTMHFHDSLGLAVINGGVQKCTPLHSWGPAVRDHYLIHYIISGKGTFSNGHETFSLSAGNGFLVAPNKQVVSYCADEHDPWEYCWVGFRGTDAARLIGQTGLSERTPIFYYDRDDRFQRLITNVYQENGTRPADEARMTAALLTLLAAMMEEFGTVPPEAGRGYQYVKSAIRFIDYHYFNSSLTVDDIASSVGISRSHLYRLFIQHIDMSPNEYLLHYRLSKASELLKGSVSLTIGEVAYSTGFSDQLYFSRAFKKQKGISPKYYAANHVKTSKTNLG